ncbi:uncharacterized protein EV420DRAFT_617996 [Desarmillaria tabescens]|uniref:Uncharacterized protein n=1 Tax=Armillaria tabescens TaxID=1929756 RepID=A0AA39N134_ARMTA|nr:uncharacterized protein EV420DRAFT_617996 [Desarmillaria tabescens]KAK0454067.1 hypothetical protein EV420DRAFT_617996 [Desarmillaria tabescens]
MAEQATVPMELTSVDMAAIVQTLDASLGSKILAAQLFGLYTGIIFVASWNIFVKRVQPVGRALAVAIVVLYILTAIIFAINCIDTRHTFANNGINFWAENTADINPGLVLAGGIMGAISTVLADLVLIWRCWIVWGYRLVVVALPALLLAAAVGLKIFDSYKFYLGQDYVPSMVLFSSFVLATTLWCTILIIFRISTIANRAGNGLHAYRHIIGVFVESSALYSASAILYVVFRAMESPNFLYMDSLMGVMRGIAPTLLLGRVAAGHAHLDDSWQGSAVSRSLRFGMDSESSNQTTFQEDHMQGARFHHDLEAQSHQRVDDLGETFPEDRTKVSRGI